MDVRQFAFLARQPSSALKSRESFCGLPKRGLALILANALFWKPLLAQADGIVVSAPGTTVGQAGNGVPVVNIAAPNGSGLSHNQFKDYNVGANGVILNNARDRTQSTQLGGIILGNPNLQGRAANIILNEVSGGSPSQLRGYTEVAGQSAKVIVANPYGISCNGCGFINTPNVTLTTGKPILDNGRLDRYQVDGGAVTIDGQGLNASNVDRFEIITRSAKINAQINARNLTVIAGRNDVNAQTLNATARADDGSAKPELAIDSSALGGMYAGAIRLVGTEAGVGVKLDGTLAASGGDIQLDANGRLSMANAKASEAVVVKAGQLDATGAVYAGTRIDVQTTTGLSNQQSLAARDSITLTSSGQVINNGIIEAGVNGDESRNASGDVSLSTATLKNTKSVVASRNLMVTTAQTLDNQGGTLSGAKAVVNSGQIDNRGGRVLGTDSLKVSATGLDNRSGKVLGSHLNISASGAIDNRLGIFSATSLLTLQAASLNNSDAGKLSSDGRLTLNANQLENGAGRISAKGDLQATVGVLNQQAGELVSEGALSLTGTSVDNRNGGLIAATNGVDLRSQTVLNQQGEISSQAKVLLVADQLNNSAGKVIGDSGLTLTAQRLLNQSKGLLAGRESLVLNGSRLDNSLGGRVTSQKDLTINLTGDLLNQGQGTLLSEGVLTVKAGTLDNSQGGILSATNALSITTQGQLNNQAGKLLADGTATLVSAALNNSQGGEISSAQSFLLAADALNNRGGKVISGDSLQVRIAKALDNSVEGVLSANNLLQVDADSLDNQAGGALASRGALGLKVTGVLDNHNQGLICAATTLTTTAGSLNNSDKGRLSAGTLQTLSTGTLNNGQGGQLVSDGSLTLTAADVDNRSGVIGSQQALNLTVANLDNRTGLINSQSDLTLVGQRVDSSLDGEVSSKGDLKLTVQKLIQRQGRLIGERAVTLDLQGGDLDNSAGLISARGPLTFERLANLTNREQGEISSQTAFTVAAKRIDNGDRGVILSADQLRLEADAVVNANKGLISGWNGLTVVGESLDNSAEGTLSSKSGTLQTNLTGVLDNHAAGALVSQGNQTLIAGTLNNNQGIISGLADVSLNVAGRLDNSNNGLISAAQRLDFHNAQSQILNRAGRVNAGNITLIGQSLDNSAGQLISQGTLEGTLSGALNNQGGRVDSLSGNLDLQTASVANTAGGVLNSSKGWIKLVSGLFDNGSGITQAQSLNIEAKGGLLNQLGYLSALGGENRIVTTTFNNQGGGVYADTLLKVTAQDFDNQGTATGNGGKVGARSIDFGLTDTLSNGYGLIESDDALRLAAQTISNVGGTLRAMGRTGSTNISTLGLFDNRFGVLESANEHLNLQAGSLDNNGGRIVHTGTGTFDLTSDQVTRAGGSFVTNGQLDIKAASWTNSSVIQAGRLSLDIGQFTQTASGQLLGAQSLTGTGDTWTNDGLLASDATLNLTLTGGYSGNGRVSSWGGMNLAAANMDLGESARIAGGAVTQVTITNVLNNRGRLTSVGDLTVNAATLNNYGTLGGSENVRLNATHLLNETGLLFSGKDMTLRVNDFSNRFGDVYSLGGLDIARDAANGRSALIENVSGTLESDGNMRLLADTLSHRRDQFSTEKKRVSGNLNIYSNDYCKGRGCELYFTSVEKYEDVITGSSPSAFINAGGDLTVGSQTFDNLYSSVSAAGNILINTDVLTNRGAAGGEERHFNSGLYTRDRGIYHTFMERQNQFNTYNNPSSGDYRPDQMTMEQVRAGVGSFYESSSYVVPTTGSVIAQAVIQAAGSVTVNATSKIDNSVIRPNATNIDTPAANRNTHSDRFASTVKPAITAQLPPDLAQRQDNPVTLPGFSLPTGQNGLFRLSGQAAKAGAAGQTDTVTGDFSVGGRVISAAEREKTLDYTVVPARGFSLDGQPVSGAINGQGPLVLDGRTPSITRVQGMPDIAQVDNSHKYLIETNPALTDLKQFMSSDYLLGNLGYNPDASWKRLGDGLYEQRLIRAAVVARTSQRYIDGITSDDALFRYLMDNAISYKDSLNLQLGVSLTAEQVAALTHDIVWMEEAEVNGQKVLTPVLYLAQANNRLAPDGALIQGQDVSLITGGDLHNSGTLRATNNLSMVANNIDNSGLMQAGNRLEMLATDSIRNSRGGIVIGRDISATAVTGDVINERTVTTFKQEGQGYQLRNEVVSEASRFEATDILKLNAGRDVLNVGSNLKAGGNASLTAGRDGVIASQTEQDDYDYQRRRVQSTEQTTLQHASTVEVGGHLAIEARRDIAVVASTVSAAKNLSVEAGENLSLISAANEQHEYSRGKKGNTTTTTQLDNVTQQSAQLNAGGNLVAIAGTDLTLVASKISAGNEAYLQAGEKLSLLAAEDSHYSLYDMNKKGNWGSKKTQRDEVTQVTHVGSEIKTGSSMMLESGGDQLFQAAKLQSGGSIAIVSGGSVTFEAVKDSRQESHEKSKSDMAWNSAKGEGSTDETLRQTLMVGQGQLAIRAAGKINIDLKQIDQKTVSQTVDAMVQAEPQLAWIKVAEANGQVDWRMVKEIHDSWDYKQSGVGAVPALIISIVASNYLGPLAGAVASNFAVGTINGGGDIGAGLKAASSKDAVKGYATQVVTSGVLAGIDTAVGGWNTDGAMILNADGVNNPGYSKSELDWNTVSDNVLRSTAHALVAGSINTAINGGSLKDNLGTAAVSEGLDLTAAFGNKQVGDLAEYLNIAPGSAQKVLMHAVLGGALSSAKGGDFKTGALAGAASEGLTALATENLGKYLDSRFATDTQFRVGTAQLVGVLAGALVNGDPATASWVAGNAKKYNDEFHISGPAIAGAVSAGEKVLKDGGTPDQATAVMRSHLRGDGFDGPMPANGLVQAWSIGLGLPLAAIEGPAVGIGGMVVGALISGGVNFGYQLSTGKDVNYTDVSIAATVGGLTHRKGFWLTQGYGLSGAYLGSVIKGEDAKYSLLGSMLGTAIGYKSGSAVTGRLKPLIGKTASETSGAAIGSVSSEIVNGEVSNMGSNK